MKRQKMIFSVLLATILLATQIIAVGAAPAKQEATPLSGTAESITLETDAGTGVTTVLVTLTDDTGTAQTVRLSLEDATDLGLVVDGEPVDPSTLEGPITIDPGQVIPDVSEEPVTEGQHPGGSALSNFFYDLLGVDYETIMDVHDDGVGFGVIAQALWITKALDGDAETFSAIIEAKQSHDYSAITLPDGSTPQNWGQFRKAVMHDRKKSKENLGAIMSGRADNGQGDETQVGTQNNGNGNPSGKKDSDNPGKGDKDKSNNGKNNDHGKDKNKGNH